VLVGEIVVLLEGVSQFHMMQKRNVDNPKEVLLRSRLYPATLVAFDVLEVNGTSYVDKPLSERRKVLEDLNGSGLLNDHVYVAPYWGCPPEKVEEYLQMMRDQNAEGIIVKDLDKPYRAEEAFCRTPWIFPLSSRASFEFHSRECRLGAGRRGIERARSAGEGFSINSGNQETGSWRSDKTG